MKASSRTTAVDRIAESLQAQSEELAA